MAVRVIARLSAVGLFFGLSLAGVQAADSKLLNDDQLLGFLNGATLSMRALDGKTEIQHHLAPVSHVAEHGNVDVKKVGTPEIERGIWWVEEEQFCLLYRRVIDTRKRCFAVRKDGEDVRFIETRYELKGKKVERPYRWAESARLFHMADPAANYHMLTDDELVALLSGTQINLKSHDSPKEIVVHLQPVEKAGQHGVMDSNMRQQVMRGTWWVEDEQFCVYWQNNIGVRKRCFAVAQDGPNVRLIETRWEQPGKVIERPYQWVPSAQIYRTKG